MCAETRASVPDTQERKSSVQQGAEGSKGFDRPPCQRQRCRICGRGGISGQEGSFHCGSGQCGHRRDEGGGERVDTVGASGRGGSHRLALAHPGCTTVLSDSRTAVRNYTRGSVCMAAVRVLRAVNPTDRAGTIKWFPAHMGRDVSARGNANHNKAARGFTYRPAQPADSTKEWWCEAKDRMTEYSEVLNWYRLGRRTMPPPHPGLTRNEAVTFRQLRLGCYPRRCSSNTCALAYM